MVRLSHPLLIPVRRMTQEGARMGARCAAGGAQIGKFLPISELRARPRGRDGVAAGRRFSATWPYAEEGCAGIEDVPAQNSEFGENLPSEALRDARGPEEAGRRRDSGIMRRTGVGTRVLDPPSSHSARKPPPCCAANRLSRASISVIWVNAQVARGAGTSSPLRKRTGATPGGRHLRGWGRAWDRASLRLRDGCGGRRSGRGDAFLAGRRASRGPAART